MTGQYVLYFADEKDNAPVALIELSSCKNNAYTLKKVLRKTTPFGYEYVPIEEFIEFIEWLIKENIYRSYHENILASIPFVEEDKMLKLCGKILSPFG